MSPSELVVMWAATSAQPLPCQGLLPWPPSGLKLLNHSRTRTHCVLISVCRKNSSSPQSGRHERFHAQKLSRTFKISSALSVPRAVWWPLSGEASDFVQEASRVRVLNVSLFPAPSCCPDAGRVSEV